jgi:ABC-type Na+ efflux pump permease subunit
VKKRVADQMSGANDPAAQQRAQFQQMMEQLQGMLMEAQVRRENAAASKDEAATVESHIDAAVKTATFTNGNEQAGQEGKPASKSQVSVN